MNGDPADVLAHDFHLADVDTGPDLQAVTVRRVSNRRRAAQRLPGAVEGRQQPVTRRLHLAPAVSLELGSRGDEVLGEEPPPPGIAELGRLCGRADEIGEEQRGENPGPTSDQEAGEERSVARPEDLDARLVANDVAVVTRWDVHDVVRPVDDLRPVRVEGAETTRDHESHVMDLTPLPAHARTQVLRPPPARLGDQATHGELALHDDLRRELREPDDLVRRPKALDLGVQASR